jgi:COP9 signalosome complex subunit 2
MDVLYDQNHQILIDGLTCILNEMESRQSSPFAVWFSAASRLSKLLLDKGDLASTQAIIEKMKASCRDADGCDDILSKASQLVDVYALGVRLVDMTGASDGVKRMKQILARCEKVNAAVCNPRSAGVLREYGGKILMQQGRYDDAYNEFYEAFRAFSDAGQTRGKKLLKYAVVANILSLSNINPFDCREAKAYQTDPDLTDIASLRKAVDEGDLGAVHSLATSPRFFESEDSWLEPYGLKIVIEIKQKYLERILPAYASVEIESLARRINEDPGTTRKMLKILILDNRVRGSLIEDRFVAKRSVDGDKSQENEMITSSKYMCTYTEELLDQGITVGSK